MVKTIAPELLAPKVDAPPSDLVTATAQTSQDDQALLAGARAFAAPLIGDQLLDSGENMLAHADAMADMMCAYLRQLARA